MLDIFYKPESEYTEPLNPVKAYLTQLSFYIETKLKCTREIANQKAIAILKAKFKDRQMKCFERLENGDRVAKTTTIYKYIKGNLDAGNVLAPTLTSYMPRSVKPSILSDFIFEAVAQRSVAKKESHKAKAKGDLLLYTNKDNEQNNLKTYCNSMSGSFAQEACILHNPANHSTLTSLTRTMTSLSNANNERLIAGNRYYPRGIDVLNNCVFISTMTNVDAVRRTIDRYGLKIPTVEDTVKVLKWSSDLYFQDRNYYSTKVIPFLEGLKPEHLTAICYMGDMYHLRQFNPDFMRSFMVRMSEPIVTEDRLDDVCKKLRSIDENVLNLAHHIFFHRMRGKGKVYEEITDIGLLNDLYATACNVQSVLLDYKLLFNTFFVTPIFPPNSFRLKNMRRRVVVLSDTDSTCFTTDEWVTWFGHGEFNINPKTIAMATVVAFVTTQSIINMLRVLSRNLNVDRSLIGKLGMKNEFLWLAHAPAEVSKHYFAYTVSQELIILTEPELEVKGVHLKNSAVSKVMTKDAADLMKRSLVAVSRNEKLSLSEFLGHVVGIEDSIQTSVMKGEPVFLKRSKIKEAGAYSQGPDKSPFARHTFWNLVFGPKYGMFGDPPYSVIKVPTTIDSKTKLNRWVESIEDAELKARLVGWLIENNKKDLPTIYLNIDWVAAYGVPDEILRVVDVKRIVLDVTIQHRVFLETLGVMLYADKMINEQFMV